jgi:hypothetical protein
MKRYYSANGVMMGWRESGQFLCDANWTTFETHIGPEESTEIEEIWSVYSRYHFLIDASLPFE